MKRGEPGRADNSGVFQQTWDTSTATMDGTCTSWVKDEGTGRVSNQVQISVNQ